MKVSVTAPVVALSLATPLDWVPDRLTTSGALALVGTSEKSSAFPVPSPMKSWPPEGPARNVVLPLARPSKVAMFGLKVSVTVPSLAVSLATPPEEAPDELIVSGEPLALEKSSVSVVVPGGAVKVSGVVPATNLV